MTELAFTRQMLEAPRSATTRTVKVYAEAFARNRPARTTFGVAALPLGARIEIDCIATVP